MCCGSHRGLGRSNDPDAYADSMAAITMCLSRLPGEHSTTLNDGTFTRTFVGLPERFAIGARAIDELHGWRGAWCGSVSSEEEGAWTSLSVSSASSSFAWRNNAENEELSTQFGGARAAPSRNTADLTTRAPS